MNNSANQISFCEKFNFTPVGKVICLNWLPKNLKAVIPINESTLKDINICLNMKFKCKKFWLWPINEEKSDVNFPDPCNYLIGIYVVEKNVFINLFNYFIFYF